MRLHLNRAIIPQRIYYWDYRAGSDASRYQCDRNPNKEQRLGCVCVIVYHRVLSVITVGIIMAFIRHPAACVRLPESFSQKQRSHRHNEENTAKRFKIKQKLSVWHFSLLLTWRFHGVDLMEKSFKG